MGMEVIVTRSDGSGFGSGNGETTVGQFFKAQEKQEAAPPPSHFSHPRIYAAFKKKFPVEMENHGWGPTAFTSTAHSHYSDLQRRTNDQTGAKRVLYDDPKLCVRDSAKTDAPWATRSKIKPAANLNTYQMARLHQINPIEAEHQAEGPYAWETTYRYAHDEEKEHSPSPSYFGGDQGESRSGFSRAKGPTHIDEIQRGADLPNSRPSSAKFQQENPLERENGGLGPSRWTTSSRSASERAVRSAAEPESEVSVHFGAPSGVPQYRLDQPMPAQSQASTFRARPRSAWMPCSPKARECPVYEPRNARGIEVDPWATTSQIAFQAPPTCNNFFAFRNAFKGYRSGQGN